MVLIIICLVVLIVLLVIVISVLCDISDHILDFQRDQRVLHKRLTKFLRSKNG